MIGRVKQYAFWTKQNISPSFLQCPTPAQTLTGGGGHVAAGGNGLSVRLCKFRRQVARESHGKAELGERLIIRRFSVCPGRLWQRFPTTFLFEAKNSSHQATWWLFQHQGAKGGFCPWANKKTPPIYLSVWFWLTCQVRVCHSHIWK